MPARRFTVSRITLRDGFVAGDGGSIYISLGGTVVISNTLLTNNRTDAAHSGGAIVNYGALTILQSTFEDNVRRQRRRDLPRWSGSRTFVDHSIFRRNSTTSATDGWGGAILLWDGAPLVIQDSTIEENTATYGGGIYNFPNSSIVMTRTVVRANTAQFGAGIYNQHATLRMSDSMLLDNMRRALWRRHRQPRRHRVRQQQRPQRQQRERCGGHGRRRQQRLCTPTSWLPCAMTDSTVYGQPRRTERGRRFSTTA